MKQIVAAKLIREYLAMHPEGAFTEDVWEYVCNNGYVFQVNDVLKQQKSVSGELSKMKSNEIVSGEKAVGRRGFLWKLVKAI